MLDSDSEDWFVDAANSSWLDAGSDSGCDDGPTSGACRALAITGPSGVGKTAAVAACAQVRCAVEAKWQCFCLFRSLCNLC